MKRVILLIAVFTFTLFAQQPSASAQNEFNKLVEDDLQAQQLVGLSVAVIHNEKEWTAAYGYADLENRVKTTPASRFRLASVTKPMTAVGILLLVQQGKVKLDEQVQTYVPGFPQKKYPVTIRQLLGHLSGISHYKNYDAEANTTRQMPTEDALAIFKEWELLFEPETRFQYTTYGYNLLGAVIEAAGGQSYQDFMSANVWGPLNMSDISVDYLYKLIPNRASGYTMQNGEIINSRPVSTSLKIAGGGTRATALDMARFAAGLNNGKVLQSSWRDSMWMPMALQNGRYTGYGMGWGIGSFNGRYTVQHSGGQEGTRTYLLNFPAEKLSIAIASNFEQSNPGKYAYRLAELILNEKENPLRPYFTDQSRQIIFEMMESIYANGFSYFDYFKRPFTRGAHGLDAAFAYVNNFDNSPRQDSLLQAGIHPVADNAFVTAGSFMASTIKDIYGEQRLEKLHKSGVLAFFNTYVEACREYPQRIPYTLEDGLEAEVSAWYPVWQSFEDGKMLSMKISATTDIEKTRARLEEAFTNKSLFPDYSDEFVRVSRTFLQQDDIAKAQKFAETAKGLYPGDGDGSAMLGVLSIISGNPAAGKLLIEEALQANPGGLAAQSSLNTIAYELAARESYDEAIALLQVAIELNPQVANLYDSTGEMYLRKGDHGTAVEWYKKALKVDPDFINAQQMLKQIEESGK